MWLWKTTPSSLTVRRLESENTWKPPESVSSGPCQRVNACSPPSARTIMSPGRR